MYAVVHVARVVLTTLASSSFFDFSQSALGQIDILEAIQCFYAKICPDPQTLLRMYAVAHVAHRANDFGSFFSSRFFNRHIGNFCCFNHLCRVVSQDPLIYADRSSTLCKAFHTNLILSELQNLVLVKLLPNPYLKCSSLFRISPQQSILYHRICLIARYR